MSIPYWSPNFATCPECGNDQATDHDHPESGWFTCECGEQFEGHKTRIENEQ